VLVLAVDTTTPRASVALVDAEAVLGEVRWISESHSERLMPAIAFLMSGQSVSPRELDGFAVATGPGSFTGLRVGLSTVQGLALAAGRPSVGVSSLDVLAAKIVGRAERLVAMTDAFRDEVYGGVYDGLGTRVSQPVLERWERFVEGVPDGAAFIGDGARRYRSEILARRPGSVFPDRSLFLAAALGRLAEPLLLAGRGVPPEALRPLYLRDVSARKSP
jgi:tRNA threonylcarbamoyladenosine biosynthesis protein TsaB